MDSPQKENGFTPIAHEILEEVAKRKFTATQHSILLVVWRMTYGFHRKDHGLALTFLVKATGFSKRGVQDAISQLIDANVLHETQQSSFNRTRKLAFNKRYGDWEIESRIKNDEVKQSSPGKGEFHSEVKQASTDEVKQTSTKKDKYKDKYKDIEGGKEMNPDPKELITNKYLQRRAHGFDLSAEDEQAIERLLNDDIPIEKILEWIDEIFDEFKPKHRLDRIKHFKYVEVTILDKWVKSQEPTVKTGSHQKFNDIDWENL